MRSPTAVGLENELTRAEPRIRWHVLGNKQKGWHIVGRPMLQVVLLVDRYTLLADKGGYAATVAAEAWRGMARELERELALKVGRSK